jgi:protoheme IX farnesyltransferase
MINYRLRSALRLASRQQTHWLQRAEQITKQSRRDRMATQRANTRPRCWRDYLELTKPRVVVLMLITSLVGMFSGHPRGRGLEVLIFGNLGIGCAPVRRRRSNHVVDRRIDSIMARTLKRPVTSGRISPSAALGFALLLAVIGMALLLTLPTSWQPG